MWAGKTTSVGSTSRMACTQASASLAASHRVIIRHFGTSTTARRRSSMTSPAQDMAPRFVHVKSVELRIRLELAAHSKLRLFDIN